MVNKKKLAFFSVLFFIVFTIIGDAYFYYLDGKIFESDFKYTTDVKSKDLNLEYIQDLEQLQKDLHLKIYVITSTINSHNSATFTVYSTDENKDFLKRRILVQKDHSTFKSLITGKREIIFKPLGDIAEIEKEEYYYVFGTKESVDKLRSATIDKYGMSKPEENEYPNDATFMIISGWIFVFFVIFLYTLFEVNNLKKEVLIKYLNGSDKKRIIIPLMITNSITIFISALIGMSIASFITEATKFLIISILMLLFMIISTNALYLLLRNLDIKKTFAKSNYTIGYKALAFVVLFIITITLILTLTLNLKTMHDAILTINQENKWEKFYDYDNILFFFKEETDTTNYETDEKHAVDFYNDHLDKYRIYLSFDFSNNGGITSRIVNVNEPVVYLNKHAKKEIKALGIDPNQLKKDRYYIISKYTDAELKENGIFDPAAPNEITFLLDNDDRAFETITNKKPYELLVYDINMTNLADNYKKNPIIIFDTHSIFPSNDLSLYVFNSLVKFNNDNDYANFIKKIGYENEVVYKNNVKDLYMEKRAEKMLVLFINIILSTMMLILFNISLSAILKMDLNSRAIEIALNKVFGKTFFQRYKGLFRLLMGAFILGVGIALMEFYHSSFLYVFFASIIVLINMIVILTLFINNYERISISRILKGGV